MKQKVFEVIDTVKAQYPASVFPDNGVSPDSQAGTVARLICDNIKREMEIMFNEDVPTSSSLSVEEINLMPTIEDILRPYDKSGHFIELENGKYYHRGIVVCVMAEYSSELEKEITRLRNLVKTMHLPL